MSTAFARVHTSFGLKLDLYPGDWIGRHAGAALRLDDARVSEAHALVSLRGRHLWLLALRGQLRVGGLPATEVRLAPGQHIELAPGHVLSVVEVCLPERVLALLAPEGAPVVLQAPVYSLMPNRLMPGWVEGALGTVWSDGQGYRARIGAGEPRILEEGDTLKGGLRVVSVALEDAATPATRASRLYPPLRIVARYETAHLHRERAPVLVLHGHPARIISLLASMGVPAPWNVLASELWPDEDDSDLLRRRFDRNLGKLRENLREGSVRPDLIRPDGNGNYELVLMPGDEVVDET